MHSTTELWPQVTPLNMQTRASLLQRVRDWGDDASWREFFSTYSRLIYSMALKYGLTGSEAEDVVQGTMMSVASSIRNFEYNREAGSFKQWIGTHATWRIHDQLRRTKRHVGIAQGGASTAAGERMGKLQGVQGMPDEQNNLESFFERDWDEAVSAMALAQVKMKVRPKHFQIFDLYAVKQWPLQRISRTLGVNVAQVYLVKSRVALLLKQETRRVKAQLERVPGRDSFNPNKAK